MSKVFLKKLGVALAFYQAIMFFKNLGCLGLGFSQFGLSRGRPCCTDSTILGKQKKTSFDFAISASELNGDHGAPESALTQRGDSVAAFKTVSTHEVSNAATTEEIDKDSSGATAEELSTEEEDLPNLNLTLVPPLAPPLSFGKFVTMQDKRVVVTIRYSADAGLKPYFLTLAKKLKNSHPDVLIERRILQEAEEQGDEATFELLVDGKTVMGRGRKARGVDLSKAIFVSMQEIDTAISRARRKRRPSTLYGGEPEQQPHTHTQSRAHWKDP